MEKPKCLENDTLIDHILALCLESCSSIRRAHNWKCNRRGSAMHVQPTEWNCRSFSHYYCTIEIQHLKLQHVKELGIPFTSLIHMCTASRCFSTTRYVVEEVTGSCAREPFDREDDRRRCLNTAAAVLTRGGCAHGDSILRTVVLAASVLATLVDCRGERKRPLLVHSRQVRGRGGAPQRGGIRCRLPP
jgi:hypothetical protein